MADDKDSTTKNDKTKPESEFEKIARSYRTGWYYAEYAFQYGVTIVLCSLCSLIGYWLDGWLGTGHILLIIFVMFGAVAGFINLIRGLNIKAKNGTKKF
jgi:F0F1-type ATP synthase assembly protein I